MAEEVAHSSRGTIYKVVNGQIVRPWHENKDDEKDKMTRTNKLGNLVHERAIAALRGRVVDIFTKKLEHGYVFNIIIEDLEGHSSTLSIQWNDGYVADFMKRYANVDPNAYLSLGVFAATTDSGKSNHLFMLRYSDSDELVARKYTKDNPGLCPPWERTEDALGEVKWSNTKEMVFLLKECVEKVRAYMRSIGRKCGSDNEPATSQTVHDHRPVPSSTPPPPAEEEDDLPF